MALDVRDNLAVFVYADDAERAATAKRVEVEMFAEPYRRMARPGRVFILDKAPNVVVASDDGAI